MVDFYRKLSPEARARVDANREFKAEQRRRFAAMSNASLAASAEYYMQQMSPIDWAPGEPIYDAAFWHAIIPEMLKRLSDTKDPSDV